MKYIIYCRKSTDTEDKQILSLDSQESEMRSLAEGYDLEVISVLKESQSAKTIGRPVFRKLIQMIQEKEADGIICWKLDRLARNMVEGGEVIELLQTGVIKEIRTFESVHVPSDNVLLLAVHFGMANQYSRDLSANVKRGNRAKLERGEWPAPAPFGYLNDRLNKKIIQNKRQAPYIKRAFELYATGGYSLSEVTKILYSEGLRTNSGNKIPRSSIHRILNNKFYIGLMERGGKIYQGIHPPIVSKQLFDEAQSVLNRSSHPKKEKRFYSARGFLTCDVCSCMLTADTQKGYQYYFCTNGKGVCNEHRSYMRSEHVDELLSGLFQNLSFDEELVEISGQAYIEMAKQKESHVGQDQERIKKDLKSLEERESLLTDAFISKTLRKDLYESKMKEIEISRLDLKSQLSRVKKERPEVTFERIKEVFLDCNKASNFYLALSDTEKRKVLETVLSNATIKDKKVAQYQYKKPFAVLAKAPKNASPEIMLRGQDSNLQPTR